MPVLLRPQRNEGPRALWNGLGATCGRNCTFNGICASPFPSRASPDTQRSCPSTRTRVLPSQAVLCAASCRMMRPCSAQMLDFRSPATDSHRRRPGLICSSLPLPPGLQISGSSSSPTTSIRSGTARWRTSRRTLRWGASPGASRRASRRPSTSSRAEYKTRRAVVLSLRRRSAACSPRRITCHK